MKEKSIYSKLSSLGPVGYLWAPGTIASILTLPIIIFLYYLQINIIHYSILLLFFIIISIYIIDKKLNYDSISNDPPEIVLDEVIGVFITFFYIPIDLKHIILGFLLFRFFDILKPLGIKKVQNIKGTIGVIMDDIAAAILSNIILRLIFYV